MLATPCEQPSRRKYTKPCEDCLNSQLQIPWCTQVVCWQWAQGWKGKGEELPSLHERAAKSDQEEALR